MKNLAAALILLSFFIGSCSRNDEGNSTGESPPDKVSKTYQFDTPFYSKVHAKYVEDHNLGDSLVRTSPGAYLTTLGLLKIDYNDFRFEQDFIHLSASPDTHGLLMKGYEDLMNKPLREISDSEYTKIKSTRKWYTNDSCDDPFSTTE